MSLSEDGITVLMVHTFFPTAKSHALLPNHIPYISSTDYI